MNEHFIHLVSPSSFISCRAVALLYLIRFWCFLTWYCDWSKIGHFMAKSNKEWYFLQNNKNIFTMNFEWMKGQLSNFVLDATLLPQTLDIFFAATSAHRRRLMDALRHFLGIRHISVFGLFEWSQHHNLHLKRLQCKKIQSSRFFERWPYRHHHIIR